MHGLKEALPIAAMLCWRRLLHALYSTSGQMEGNTAQRAGNRFTAHEFKQFIRGSAIAFRVEIVLECIQIINSVWGKHESG